MANYDVDIDLADPNTSHAQVVDLVGADKRVLDVGCWNGELGKALRAFGCRVSGVELDPEVAAVASGVLDEVKVADLDVTPLSSLFEPASFDVVVFADVLEHLKDPRAALAAGVALLADGGRVVVSVPNVTHGSLRLGLLDGRWKADETGLLDKTHLHFYSRAGLLALLESAGLQADELRGVIIDPLQGGIEFDVESIPSGVIEWVRDQPDALVYQFQASASPVSADRTIVHTARLTQSANPDEVRLQDRFTDEAVDSAREQWQMRDHVIGLQAKETAAQHRAVRQEARIEKLRDQLEAQRSEAGRLRGRIATLERRGFGNFLRRVKRKLAG